MVTKVNRFSKTVAVNHILARADAIQLVNRFDRQDGTAQLFPKGADGEMKALIRRAVAYGEMQALESVAGDFKHGVISS